MHELLRLLRWGRPYKGRLAVAIACSLISVVCLAAGFALIKPIFEQMTLASQKIGGHPAGAEAGETAAAAAGKEGQGEARKSPWGSGSSKGAKGSLAWTPATLEKRLWTPRLSGRLPRRPCLR